MSTEKQLPDGIYLDLSFSDYLAQRRMSSSSLTKLMEGPSAFWADSWMNPDKDEEIDSDAMKLGRAYHAARLEPETFAQDYCRDLIRDDFEGLTVLATGTQIGEYLASIGETKKKAGESVMQQSERLASVLDLMSSPVVLDDVAQEPPVIWPIERALWEEEHRDKEWISPKAWDEINRDAERIRDNPEIAELITGGMAEVSILWTDKETGLQCKCRPDYMKADSVTHVKTWDARSMGMPGNRAIANNFQFNGHYRTGWFYRLGLEMMSELKVIGDYTKEQAAIINAWKQSDRMHADYFLFVRRSGIPDVRARRVKWYGLPQGVDAQAIGADTSQFKIHPTALAMKAGMEVSACFRLYQDCLELYGSEGAPWYPRDMMGEFEDADFSGYWLESIDDPR